MNKFHSNWSLISLDPLLVFSDKENRSCDVIGVHFIWKKIT